MDNTPHHLMTPVEAEDIFGSKYFYRQRIYRMVEVGKIQTFQLRGQTCYLGSHILKAFLKDLELKIASKFPNLDVRALKIFFDNTHGKRIVVDGLFGKGVAVNTDEETEEILLQKIAGIVEWIRSQPVESPRLVTEIIESEDDRVENNAVAINPILPEEITWIKVNAEVIEGVKVRSSILISLPSIATFVGIRPDMFITWLSTTTFASSVLSAHYKHIQATQNSVPWKRGVASGYVPLVPFELLPEIIVSFRQSGRSVAYEQKAELLYDIASRTLEAVGLAISGTKDKAAEELAKIGKQMGLTVADQIIAIFKQYESRDFQIQTFKEYCSKIKQIGADYAVVTGQLTMGITSRSAEMWKTFGASRHLPAKLRQSSREVMRALSPADGVGMTFGERHYTKDPSVPEAIKTGVQSKEFYQRLKKVGLLDDHKVQ
jgi:hypothetical protein